MKSDAITIAGCDSIALTLLILILVFASMDEHKIGPFVTGTDRTAPASPQY